MKVGPGELGRMGPNAEGKKKILFVNFSASVEELIICPGRCFMQTSPQGNADKLYELRDHACYAALNLCPLSMEL